MIFNNSHASAHTFVVRRHIVAMSIAGLSLCAGAAAYAIDFPDLNKAIDSAKSSLKSATDEKSLTSARAEGEAVITSAPDGSFAQAQAKAISSVQDGQAVYLHIRLPKPVKEYLFTSPGVSAPHLHLVVGPRGKHGEQFESSTVLFKESELAAKEIHLNLAPGEIRRSFLDAWLNTVARGRPGHWENEIRLLGENDTVLAIAPLTAEVSSGITKYREMYADFQHRYAVGDPSVNEAPKNAHRNDAHLAKEVQSQVTQMTGNKPEAVYFPDLGWSDHRNGLGQLEYQVCPSTEMIKIAGRGYYQNLEVKKWPNGRIEVGLDGKPHELSAESYKRQLTDSKP